MRKIIKEDLKDIFELFKKNIADAWSESELEKTFNSDNFLGFLEECDGKIVSAVTYLISLETADLLDVAVDANYRKNGKACSVGKTTHFLRSARNFSLYEKGVRNFRGGWTKYFR
jgi:hypothetical protein